MGCGSVVETAMIACALACAVVRQRATRDGGEE
jgi:hypothetical protein